MTSSRKVRRLRGDLAFEVIVGAALIVAGSIIPFTRAESASGFAWELAVGAALTALGGAYLSWVASLHATRASAEAKVRDETAARIDPITRGVGQKSGQIIETVNRGMAEEIEHDTALEIIYQMTRAVQADVVELASVAGTPYDKAPTVETIALMDELARELGSASPDLVQKLNQLRSKVETQASVESLRAATPPAPDPKRRSSVDCPNCGRSMHVSVRTNQDSTDAVCLRCFHGLSVSYPEMKASTRGPMQVQDPSPIVSRSGSRPIVNCHVCGSEISAQIAAYDNYYALCRRDETVQVVSRADFERWRENEATASPAAP